MLEKEKTNQKIKYKMFYTENKGITLIALVITIIVLLILAGVSINILIGENGLLTKSQNAADENTKGGARDKVATSVYASYNTDYNPNDLKLKIDRELLENNLKKEGGNVIATFLTEEEFSLTVEMDGYVFKIDDKCNITDLEMPLTPLEYASEDISYVGYYVDLDLSHEGPEGIIYADLAVGSGLALGTENEVEEETIRKWNNNDWAVYQYNAVKENLKKYIVGSEDVSGFGTETAWKKPMITETTGGGTTERFYVMALEDIKKSTNYTWYKNGWRKLDTSKKVEPEYNDFTQGLKNTEDWIKKYNDKDYQSVYGEQDENDLWKIIQEEGILNQYGKKWFVPSKSEWSAFGDMCYKLMGMTGDVSSWNQTFGLGVTAVYWSSSQWPGNLWAFEANFRAREGILF